MLFAKLNGEKIAALPKTNAVCPFCEQQVFSKCGEVYAWHWAHKKSEGCDSWYEPESEWHRNWKMIFGKENSEVIIRKGTKKHIADIETKDKVVIELQNSPILKPIIREREEFYGERMLWIINGKSFKHNFSIDDYFDDDFPSHYKYTGNGIVDITTGEIITIHNKPKHHAFYWTRPRESWDSTLRNVFIDFGESDLFWAKEGMGASWGKGIKVSKEDFIKKYGGDISLLNKIIDQSAFY